MLVSVANDGGIAQLVERLVRNDHLTNTPIFSQVLSSDFSEVRPRRDVVQHIPKYAQVFSPVYKEVDKECSLIAANLKRLNGRP